MQALNRVIKNIKPYKEENKMISYNTLISLKIRRKCKLAYLDGANWPICWVIIPFLKVIGPREIEYGAKSPFPRVNK